MKILVKLGGTLLDAPESRRRPRTELSALARSKVCEMVIVHGGGKQMTRFLTERGIESKFVGGLRVSTPEVIDAVLKVLAGTRESRTGGVSCRSRQRWPSVSAASTHV